MWVYKSINMIPACQGIIGQSYAVARCTVLKSDWTKWRKLKQSSRPR
jgi:hypothetical protein